MISKDCKVVMGEYKVINVLVTCQKLNNLWLCGWKFQNTTGTSLAVFI